jgi:hypothetical protein
MTQLQQRVLQVRDSSDRDIPLAKPLPGVRAEGSAR